ncbi:MAG TPA: histidine kinase [Baekduia sp.]|uniref:sensor histidine kinase n=1 Tax=Baekduia sp. TaxID=2600305 RepID=UPI002C4D3938|nr:histidine kinase [Baekduia sp.]HMJ37189.1 histidine kinase [Baekduia sp.]
MTEAAQQREHGVAQWQRPLLPAGLLDESSGGRSARDWVVDALMYLAAGSLGLLALGSSWRQHGTLMAVVDIAAGTVAFGSLWFRRRQPLRVALLTIGLSTFSGLAGGAAAAAAFNAALRVAPRSLWWIAGLSLVTAGAYPALYATDGSSYWTELVIGGLFIVVVFGWGLFVRAQRDLVHSLHERAERLEAERRQQIEQAREAERLRIAREMHDVLAHRVSLLSLHAGALEFRPDASPAEVAEAAGVIRAAAHDALQELRDVVGVLREGADDDPTEDGAPRRPQPTLAQIPALVEESRAAGMRVDCRLDAPGADAMPVALGRTAYRIVQEGLTNARKHAPAAAVEVAVTAEGEHLVVAVLNRRPVGVAAPSPEPEALPGAGTGLVGLGERVALAGGELVHGPDARGDFVLRATLPWRAA